MSLVCDNCHKGVLHGNFVSHARNRTHRLFKPNLHSARILVGGEMKRVRLCTKCLRRLKKKSPATTPTPVKDVSVLTA